MINRRNIVEQQENTDGVTANEENQSRTRSEGVSDSWKNPDVAESRKQRGAVQVNGTVYRSVNAAFKALDLPTNRHIAFRASLKKEGTKTFEQGEGLPSYEFTIVEPVKAERKAKTKKAEAEQSPVEVAESVESVESAEAV